MSAAAVLPGLAGAGAGAAVLLLLVGYRALRADPADHLQVEDLELLRPAARRRAAGGPLTRASAALAPGVRRRLPARARAALQRQVDLAGIRDGSGADAVVEGFVRWGLLLSPAVVLFLLQGQVLGVLACVAAAAFLPLVRLSRARRIRRERMDLDLPDFLDVLAVTVSAGVSFRSALARVSERLGGPLGEEFTLALQQVATGASVREAFTRLRGRTDSEAVHSFVSAFLQSEELGAPLVETLRDIALDSRRGHAQRQRQRAARVAPRVTLVTSLVLVPGTLVLMVVGLLIGSDVDLGNLLGGFG